MEKKITKATLKSFINKNRENLYIRVESSFDCMSDCVRPKHNMFAKAQSRNEFSENTLGINGVWLVGGTDYYRPFSENGFTGIAVHNCCGSFVVAIKS